MGNKPNKYKNGHSKGHTSTKAKEYEQWVGKKNVQKQATDNELAAILSVDKDEHDPKGQSTVPPINPSTLVQNVLAELAYSAYHEESLIKGVSAYDERQGSASNATKRVEQISQELKAQTMATAEKAREAKEIRGKIEREKIAERETENFYKKAGQLKAQKEIAAISKQHGQARIKLLEKAF